MKPNKDQQRIERVRRKMRKTITLCLPVHTSLRVTEVRLENGQVAKMKVPIYDGEIVNEMVLVRTPGIENVLSLRQKFVKDLK